MSCNEGADERGTARCCNAVAPAHHLKPNNRAGVSHRSFC
jgi:hypothetical protein